MKKTLVSSLFLSALVALCSGCSKKKSTEAAHDHEHEKAGHHVHVAPHGGTLVEVGEHQFNLEFILNASSGKLTAYLLDAHAENFVRLETQTLEIDVAAPGPARRLILNATANAATGETVGNTSQFEGKVDWLKGATSLTGTVARLDVRGTNFLQIPIVVPASKPTAK